MKKKLPKYPVLHQLPKDFKGLHEYLGQYEGFYVKAIESVKQSRRNEKGEVVRKFTYRLKMIHEFTLPTRKSVKIVARNIYEANKQFRLQYIDTTY